MENNYNNFLNQLLEYKMIAPVSKYVLEIIENEILDNEAKDDLMILFSIYFSLIYDGNICMSLDKTILTNKWSNKVDSTLILLEDSEFDKDRFISFKLLSLEVISNSLDLINEESLPQIIGKNKIFTIDNNWLYLMKYNNSRKSIIKSIKRLYSKDFISTNTFSYKDCKKEEFSLSEGQEKAVVLGQTKNLIVTGGPGTGKTTSILFLLLGLLSKNRDYQIYLVAPSGKASSRMKESIINGLSNLSDKYVSENKMLIDIINNLQEYTIQRLLGFDSETKGFLYNKTHQFEKNSIFVIDEASMIDICLFDSLLQAIPDEARVFMMGDKNQLPSVESGAVFGDLLIKEDLKSNIVTLDESIRFGEKTKIYALAKAINNCEELPVKLEDWKKYEEFEIHPITLEKPIYYYYNDNPDKEKLSFNEVINKWGKEFYSNLQVEATNLEEANYTKIDNLYTLMETAKILCTENEGVRGIKNINNYIIKNFINRKMTTTVENYYAGELLMITKNNKNLDLYNGDCGILVTFEDDNTLYFMVKKASNIIEKDGKEVDKIFKLGSYVFYPLRMISRNEIDFAYAITIHKSQGSDYKNILVILPKQKGHPLLNRQIVYTAITRTKGNTYILSNQQRLEEARDTVIIRDTNIS